ncbi:hypothetical protein [Romboutsia sp.]|uniref:hypothetical protein n=1 Tax=Romboutsia sp. TaxID=1965302 RepID=UPI003F305856
MYSEGNLISFTELGDSYEGIVIEKREDSSLIIFDIYGNIKTVYREDVITTDIEMNINSVNNLLEYYKHHLDQKKYEEIVRQYQVELQELRKMYSEKIRKNTSIIEKIKDSKNELIEKLDIYTYTNINKRFDEILNSKIKVCEVFTDFTNSLTEILFNRLYVLAEEGTFDVEKLKFINYFNDGQPYTQQPKEWNDEAKNQANSLISKIDKELGIDTCNLYNTTLEIEDRIIFGGALKDLTLERNYKFIPNKISNKKEEIDKVLIEVSDFAKKYILDKDYIVQDLCEDDKPENKILIFPKVQI